MGEFVQNCLVTADQENLQSIAFPSLGTGSLKFPPHSSARIMFQQVQRFSTIHRQTCLKSITFAIFDKPVMKEFRETMEAMLKIPSLQRQPTGPMNKAFMSPGWKAGTTLNCQMITNQGVSVKIFDGSITDQQVDVIVNLTSEDLNLSSGAASKSVLKAAGNSIQDECKKQYPHGIMLGQIAVTSAGKIRGCRHIYHSAVQPLKNSNGNHEEMGLFIRSCLEYANSNFVHSMAFPSLGTGTLGYSDKTIAKLMYKEVQNFSKNYKDTRLKDIRFVIFDKNIRKVFEQEAKSLPNKGRRLAAESSSQQSLKFSAKGKIPNNPSGSAKEMKFCVYGREMSNIQSAIQQIDHICDQNTDIKKLYNRETIKKLTPEQVEEIKNLHAEYRVEIRFKDNIIEIEGLKDDVHEAFDRIQRKILNIERDEKEAIEMELYQHQAQWQYQENDEWEDYPPDINAAIVKAKNEGKMYAEWQEEEGSRKIGVRLDFKGKVEICASRNTRLPVRQMETDASGGSFAFPQEWDPMLDRENLKKVYVRKTSAEYKKVLDEFDKSVKKDSQASYSKVEKIERIQNRLQYQNYMAHKVSMEKRTPKCKNPIERTLWHATRGEVVDKINNNGFDRGFSGLSHGAWYGKGVYTATHAGLSVKAYSGSGSGSRYIYRCRGLTGDYVQVPQTRNKESAIRAPPPKDPKNPAVLYDCVVDDQQSPNEWIFFKDFVVYPDYLITYAP